MLLPYSAVQNKRDTYHYQTGLQWISCFLIRNAEPLAPYAEMTYYTRVLGIKKLIICLIKRYGIAFEHC